VLIDAEIRELAYRTDTLRIALTFRLIAFTTRTTTLAIAPDKKHKNDCY